MKKDQTQNHNNESESGATELRARVRKHILQTLQARQKQGRCLYFNGEELQNGLNGMLTQQERKRQGYFDFVIATINPKVQLWCASYCTPVYAEWLAMFEEGLISVNTLKSTTKAMLPKQNAKKRRRLPMFTNATQITDPTAKAGTQFMMVLRIVPGTPKGSGHWFRADAKHNNFSSAYRVGFEWRV